MVSVIAGGTHVAIENLPNLYYGTPLQGLGASSSIATAVNLFARALMLVSEEIRSDDVV